MIQRLLRLENDQVVFTWKDYARDRQIREMSLPAEELIRRFLLHILPDRFVRIRSYGLLANRQREKPDPVPQAPQQAPANRQGRTPAYQPWRDLLLALTGIDATLCPACGQGRLQRREPLVPARRLQMSQRPPP